MRKEDFEGWTNYETWAAALAISGDKVWMEKFNIMAKEAIKNAPDESAVKENIWTVKESTKFVLADCLKNWIESETVREYRNPGQGQTLRNMLLKGALNEVNWEEIAQNKLESLAESA